MLCKITEDIKLIITKTLEKCKVNLRTFKQLVKNGKCMKLLLMSGISDPSVFLLILACIFIV